MSTEQRTKIRNGKFLEITSAIPLASFPTMTEANSVDTESVESSDVSPHLVEIGESYENKITIYTWNLFN